MTRWLLLFSFAALTAASPAGQVGPPTLSKHPTVVAAVGDVLPGSQGRPISLLAGPDQDGAGRPGFFGTLADGAETEGFFWIDQGIAFTSTEVGASGFNVNGDHGIGLSSFTGDRFAVQAVGFAGERFLLSHQGIVQQEGQAAPGLPPGTVVEFVTDVQMSPAGSLYWRLLFLQSGQKSAFYRSLDASAAGRELVLLEGELIDGYEIRDVGGDFHVSDDGRHHAHFLTVKPPGQGQRGAVYLDGRVVLVKGQPVPLTGETWQTFGEVVTNDDGDLFVQGRTSGLYVSPAATGGPRDDVLALNKKVVLREGDVVDGIYLEPPAQPRDLLLSNDGRAAAIWAMNGVVGPYHLFYTSDVERFAASTRLVVSENSWLDTDGDGIDDVRLHQFLFKKSTLAFGPGESLYVLARIEQSGVLKDAILAFPAR